MTRAIVVGSGPNGLAGAIRLAQAGLDVTVLEAENQIGGGTRSQVQTVEGLVHDDCSAFHPLAVSSPFFRSLDLARHGLRFANAEVEFAHPLDNRGAGAAVFRDVERTAADLGPRWARAFGPLADQIDDLLPDALGPLARVPHHPALLARFGALAARPAVNLARKLGSEAAAAAFLGVAAHPISDLTRPLSSAAGVLLTAAGHARGWPVAVGGSAAIAAALAAELRALGGHIETGVRIDRVAPAAADVTLLTVSPRAAVRMLGGRIAPRIARPLTAYRYGPAVFTAHFAVRAGIPWRFADARRAGVVHLGGSAEEIVRSESDVVAGRMSARPFVLVGQQYLADPARARDGVVPIWAYAHVPRGWRGDGENVIRDCIEHFAPGFGDRIVASEARTPMQLERHNATNLGGDIAVGAVTPASLVARPRAAIAPSATGIPGVHLCSAATPPGAGVHGMAGFHAAEAALRDLARR